ncbi:hypothetical protein ACU4GD_23470 [Cupriavidus basilensis]
MDYAVVWRPPLEMLRGRTDLESGLRSSAPAWMAILSLRDTGRERAPPAGVAHRAPGRCRHGRPDDRLRDARGTRATSGRLDANTRWPSRPVPGVFFKPYRRADFTIGVAMGVGARWARRSPSRWPDSKLPGAWLEPHGARKVEGVQGFAGEAGQAGFLDRAARAGQCPAADAGNRGTSWMPDCWSRSSPRAPTWSTWRRGPHLVEEDLLGRGAIRLAGCRAPRLDVFRTERAACCRPSLLVRAAHHHHAAYRGADLARRQH